MLAAAEETAPHKPTPTLTESFAGIDLSEPSSCLKLLINSPTEERCLEAKAKNISLVGFRGFSADDPRQKEMQDFLLLLNSKCVNVRSLTPTTYSIPEISIYGI